MNVVDKIIAHIRSGCQAMRIVTPEETRALEALKAAANAIGKLDGSDMPLITWDSASGFSDTKSGDPRDPVSALSSLVSTSRFENNDVLFVFKDCHQYLREPLIQRTFRNLREPNLLNKDGQRRPVVFLTPSELMPNEISRSIVDVEFTLPGDKELEETFRYVHSCVAGGRSKVEASLKTRVINAMRGMTSTEAEEALFFAVYSSRGFNDSCVAIIEDEKAKTLKSNGILTYIPKTAIDKVEDIGGYDEFKKFVQIRSKLYSDKARELNMSLPKGVVLLGPPGVGKSVVSKIAAKMLNLPLVMMDFGSVFGSLVGESEAKMKMALNQVSSLGGCVLIIDDADKAFRGISGPSGDSGTSQRVFQQFLVWRSEYKGPVFVIMTMNTTEGIPPELLRPGRFDSVMCCLLPDRNARKQILQIHMRKRKMTDNFSETEWKKILDVTDRFSGAELEGSLDDASYAAFDETETHQVTFNGLFKSLVSCTPVAVSDEKTVQGLIDYCKSKKIRSVNTEEEVVQQTNKGRRAITLGE